MVVELPKGFRHMRVTAITAIWTVAFPLLVSVCDMKGYFVFAWDPFINEWGQYWRLFLLQLQFQNQSEVTIGIVLLILKLKALERYFGSVKYVKIFIMLFIYNLIVLTLFSFLNFNVFGVNFFIPSGPFGIIFGLIYPYTIYVPNTYIAEFDFSSLSSFKPLGERIYIQLTDKFGMYLLLFFLFLNEGISSMFPSFLGFCIGYLYFNSLVPINDKSLTCLDKYISKVIGEPWINTLTAGLDVREEEDEEAAEITEERNHAESRDDTPDTPARSLGQQMLDTFRR